ncbi:hypothetical protein [Burkholderia sp. BCC0044]|uniref:hypothetical protein n=1 Tax=Burkholderia sp. BCC0044 TaxID=2676295 RepID=UPI00158B686D|nr:hypothetical protein [Burkholderia sp. BCC0044]
MLYRFASARNLSNQYLRVYSERASALHDAQIRHSRRRRRLVEVPCSGGPRMQRFVANDAIAMRIDGIRRADMSSTVAEPAIRKAVLRE